MPEKQTLPSRFVEATVKGYRAFKETFVLGGPGEPPEKVETANPEKFFRFNYPVGVNATEYSKYNEFTAVAKQGVSFTDLRFLSDANEMVRSIIDNCKDQLSKLGYTFQYKMDFSEKPEEYRKRTAESKDIKFLKSFFTSPDTENTFRQWLRIALEEVLVTDALAIAKVTTGDGSIHSLEIIDGTTIQPLIDTAGRRPKPPYPAYIQFIEGVPVAEFTTDELLYFRRNPRVHKFFGQSPMEQFVIYSNVGLRRVAMQTGFYTDGNLPIGLKEVPESWTPEQIEQYQTYWDLLFVNDPTRKSRMHFVPGGGKDPVFPQKDTLKDEFDEWLARVACHCFSVSANPFIKSLNRASSEQSREQADEEGLFSRMIFFKDLIDTILSIWFGMTDIEFAFVLDRKQDNWEQAKTDVEYIKHAVKSVDEVRMELGLHPIGLGHCYFTNSGLIAVSKDAQNMVDQLVTTTQVILTDRNKENDPEAPTDKEKQDMNENTKKKSKETSNAK